MTKTESLGRTTFNRLHTCTIIVQRVQCTAIHLSTTFPIERSADTEFVDLKISIETQEEIRGNLTDHTLTTDLRQAIFVYDNVTVVITQESRTIDYREFIANIRTYLRINETSQENTLYTRSQLIYVVIDLREVKCHIPFKILRIDRIDSQRNLMSVRMDSATIGY